MVELELSPVTSQHTSRHEHQASALKVQDIEALIKARKSITKHYTKIKDIQTLLKTLGEEEEEEGWEETGPAFTGYEPGAETYARCDRPEATSDWQSSQVP